MSDQKRSGWLPGWVLLGVLAATPLANADQNQGKVAGAADANGMAQVATPRDPATPAQDAGQIPVTAPGSPGQAGAPDVRVSQPTDEMIGDSLSAHQRYQAALAAYVKIQDPSAAVWNKMGIAYQMMFNLKDASRCYANSLKKDPKNPQVLNNVATVYDSQKDYGTAEHYYRKALRIEPKSALILRNLGSNYMSQRKFSRGAMCFQQAMAIDPSVFDPNSGIIVQNPSTAKERGAMHYYMARSCVTAGQQGCAILNLRLALNEGFTNPKKVAADSAFASLRPLPAFQQLIAAQGTQSSQ
jgi:Tfp pilus assembly protein PilF